MTEEQKNSYRELIISGMLFPFIVGLVLLLVDGYIKDEKVETITRTQNNLWIDKETNLVWELKNIKIKDRYRWKEAIEYCENLSLYNSNSWRLPTLEELETLGNIKLFFREESSDWEKWYKKNKDKKEGDFFIKDSVSKNVNFGGYWSSTVVLEDSQKSSWAINFYQGYIYMESKAQELFTMCVTDKRDDANIEEESK